MKRNLFLSFILVSIVFLPTVLLAQVPVNTLQTDRTLGRFNPGITSNGGGSSGFNGLNFSGVGGALLSCNNVGESTIGAVSNLFKSAETKAKEEKDKLEKMVKKNLSNGYGTNIEQPVVDNKTAAEVKKINQRENCLNGVAYAVSRNLLQQVSTKTLNWVNTGLNGSPLYVKDQISFFGNIYNEQINKYLKQVPEENTLFGTSIRDTLISQLTGKPVPEKKNQPTTPEQQAYKAFTNDFTQGGWSAWLNTTQNAQNNPIGAYLTTVDKIGRDYSKQAVALENELLQGNGFLSMKKCVLWEADTSIAYTQNQYNTRCITTTPRIGGLGGDTIPAPGAPSWCATYNDPVPTKEPVCLKSETVTPGKIIADQVSYITNSPVRQLEYADQINEVLGSFFDNMLTSFFSSGLGGVGNTNGSLNNWSSASIGSDGQLFNPALNETTNVISYQNRSNNINNGEFDISRPQQLRAVLKTQIDFLNRSRDSQIAMARVVPTLAELDYCLPGPNPSWKIGTDYNANLFLSTLEGKSPSGNLGRTISSIYNVGAAVAVASGVGAPIGLVIAAVGNVVGSLADLARGDHPDKIKSESLDLFDKVNNSAQRISDYAANRQNFFDNINLISFLERTHNSLMADYSLKFSSETLTNAFVATDPSNKPHIEGRMSDVLRETNNLVYYNQSVTVYDKQYTQNITETQEAVEKLRVIDNEVEEIVRVAKARYIKEQAAKGTPVKLQCINAAYNVSTTPITGVTRLEPSTTTLDPRVEKVNQAREYFYSHL